MKIADIIYVHPRSQMFLKEIIPLSVPALVSLVPHKIAGRFEEELTGDEIRGARIILMDIHWYLSLPAALKLALKIKKANPRARIIAGGITATVFAREIVMNSAVDYVIRGDAEGPLPALIDKLMSGVSADSVPNIVHRDFESPWSYALDSGTFARLRYNDLSFFPSLERNIAGLHRSNPDRTHYSHPYLVSFRGCPVDCDRCVGAPKKQRDYFKRGPLVRPAEKTAAELADISDSGKFGYINVFHDFISMGGERYWRTVLGRKYGMKVYYEFASTPPAGAVAALTSSFTGGVLDFAADNRHVTSAEPAEPGPLAEAILEAGKSGRFRVFLAYSSEYYRSSPRYRASVDEVRAKTGCALSDVSYWWTDIPLFPNDEEGISREFARYSANRGRKFTVTNALFRATCTAERFFPHITSALVGRFGRDVSALLARLRA